MSKMGDIANPEILFSWGRYLYWADVMHRDWDKFMFENAEDDANTPAPDWLRVNSYWAASLYVVIEGWETAKFKDPVVDALLGVSTYKDMLRRLRNGTFHYQPTLLSPKVTEFFRSAEVLGWLYFLHQELCRWLRDHIEQVEHEGRFAPKQKEKWRQDCATLVGWLPLRPAEEELESIKKLTIEAKQKLDASGDDSEAGKQLRASLGLHDEAAKKTTVMVRQYRRDRLAELGLNPDDYIP